MSATSRAGRAMGGGARAPAASRYLASHACGGVAQTMIAANSSHFCAGQREHDRFGQLLQTEWLREKLCIGAEVVGHQRGIREAGHKENGQVGPSAARLTRQVDAGH